MLKQRSQLGQALPKNDWPGGLYGGGHPQCASDEDIRAREHSREEGRWWFQQLRKPPLPRLWLCTYFSLKGLGARTLLSPAFPQPAPCCS